MVPQEVWVAGGDSNGAVDIRKKEEKGLLRAGGPRGPREPGKA